MPPFYPYCRQCNAKNKIKFVTCACVCVWFEKTGKCLVEFWMILYLVSSHIVNIYLFVWWWNQNPMIFSLCNSHLIWMFWGKNLEPFWIIIEQCYKDCREAIITRCDVFIISLLRSDDLPKEMRRQATIQEFSPSEEQSKLHRHWLDTNCIYIYCYYMCNN